MPYINDMKPFKEKRSYLGAIICLMLFFVFIISCKGQDKTNEQKEQVVEEPITSTTEFMDPLSAMDANPVRNETGLPIFYDGQLSHWIRNIFEDSKGNLWLGTNHYGIIRHDGDTLEYISEKNGIGGGRINDMVEDEAGNVWFSTYGGLSKYDGASFSNYPVTVGDHNNDLFALIIDKNDKFWVSTVNGVLQFDGETFTNFPIPRAKVKDPDPVLSPKRITTILEDSKGHIWFGTDGFGITRYNPFAEEGEGSFTFITTEDGLPDNRLSQIFEDSKGNIWISTMFGGVSQYVDGVFNNFTKEGLVDGIETGGFYEDRKGNIWFAAEHHGVYRYDGNTFTNFHETEGLESGGILSMLEDTKGRFWMGGWKGLFRYDPSGEKLFVPVTRNGPWDK